MEATLELTVMAALLVASIVGMIARRLRLPYTVSLVLAGLAIAVVRQEAAPGFEIGLHLTPELLFLVLLPVLVYEAAFHLELRHFVESWRAIVALAVPGVVVGIVVSLVLAWSVLHLLGVPLTWQVLLVTVTILAATDPVGVLAVLREVGAPRDLAIVMEGESLLNDGVAIVAFGVVLVALGVGPHTGGLSASWVLRFLSWEVAGAVVIGGGIGFALSWLVAQVDDHLIEITLTTVAAFGSFVVADLTHASGVIACLVAGTLSGNFGARYGMSPTTRVAVTSFWEYATFVANSVVFLLIGLEITPARLLHRALPIVVLWLALLAARALFVAVIPFVTRQALPGRGSFWVLSWGGLRGGVAMVLALSVPAALAGRSAVIDLVFGVSLLTILVQAPLTAPLLGWVGLGRRGERGEVELLRARLRALHAAAAYLHRQHELGAISEAVFADLEEELAQRRRAIEAREEAMAVARERLEHEEAQALRRQIGVVEKEAIRHAWAEGLLDDRRMHRLIGEVDDRLYRLGQDDRASRTCEEPRSHLENT